MPIQLIFLKKFFGYFLVGVIVVGVGTYFRLYPLLYHASSDAREKATLLVLSRLKNTTAHQIHKNLPQLSSQEKSRLSQESFDYLLRHQNRKVKSSIDKLSKEIDQKYSSANTIPYLLEADPYNYFGLTKNIVKTGNISETIHGSKYFNKLMLAPEGHWEPLTLHPYLGYYLYRILCVFNPDIPLMYAVSFTPVVLAALCLIPFLFLTYLLGCPLVTSCVAAMFFMLSPIFLERSAFGWYDNDPYNILFPLLVLSTLFLGLKRLGEPKKSFFFAILGGFFIGIYAFFWQGWVYLLAIVSISGLGVMIYNHSILKERKNTKNLFWYFGAFVFFGFFIISIVFGIHDFFVLFAEGGNALKFFLSPQLTLWPDVFISVGELRKSSLIDIIQHTGGGGVFVFALVGLITAFLKSRQRPQGPDALKIIIAILFAFTIFMALGAQRFALLSVVPIGLFFALGLQNSYDLSKEFMSRINIKRLYKTLFLNVASTVIVIVMSILLLQQAHETILAWRPIFNETWDKALKEIKEKTPPDAIINSWWPPGHFITSMAERRVTFDGATINNPQAYWMAHLLLSSDETYALGILRMLNNSANQAIAYLQGFGFKLSEAVNTVKNISPLNRQKAKLVLKGRLTDEQMEGLLTLTHSNPPPSYLFLYNDLMEKNLELGFIGRWNFEKVEHIRMDPKAASAVPNPNSVDYIRFLWDLVGGPLNYSEILTQNNRKGEIVFFPQNMTVNLSDMSCVLLSEKFGHGIPKSLIYFDDQKNKLVEKSFLNYQLPFAVFLFKEDALYHAMVIDRRLAYSLIFRLYFFNGKGLNYFEPFVQEKDLTGRTKIFVYRINWKKFKEDIEER